jgi:alkylhydroperoxidase family enzyme
LVRGMIALSRGVYDPKGEVDLGLKRLVGHAASMAAGCLYCRAHTGTSAMRHGVSGEKLAALPDYATSPLYNDAERAAIDFALAAASQPNMVDDALFARLSRHWSDGQIVEILAVVGLFGYFNRWNDSMATTLEAEPLSAAQQHLAATGWQAGKHAPNS